MVNLTERQKEIINVAVAIIAEEGMQKLSIKNISNRIGISEPAIYRHFDSKIDILLAVLKYFIHSMEAILNDGMDAELSPLKQIESVLMNFFRRFNDNPQLVTIIFSEEIFPTDDRIAKEIFSIIQLNQMTFVKLIEKGKIADEIDNNLPSDQLATIILGALRVVVKKWHLSKYSFDLIDEGYRLLETLIMLLKKR